MRQHRISTSQPATWTSLHRTIVPASAGRRSGLLLAAMLIAAAPLPGLTDSHAQEGQTAADTGSADTGSADTGGADTSGTTVYVRSFFDQFAPQNAFEMVQRLPGFVFDGGSEARGFGGTAGNVLIDGARPGSKNSLQNVLERIPAAQVERIEVIRGGVGASDAAGQTVVANVVRIPGASTGTAIARLVRRADGKLHLQTETSYSTTLNGWETSSKLDATLWRGPRDTSFRRFDADGTLTDSAEEERPERDSFIWYTGEASKDLFDGKFVVNTVLGTGHWRGDTSRDNFDGRLPDDMPDSLIEIDADNKYSEASLGLDWTKTRSNDWRIRLLTFTQLNWRDFTSLFTEDLSDGERIVFSDFARSTEELESILRATYGKVGGSALKPEFGAEVAYNQLISSFNLFSETFDGISETIENRKVSEIRAETFVNMVWNANDKLTLDGGLTWEISRIKVTGDIPNEQTFRFLKPSLNATYNVRDDLQLQLRANRTVGQLDFQDFAASNNFGDGRQLEGNTQLSPDQTWRLEGSVDWRFNSKGSLVVTLFHEWRNDVLEQIPLETGGFGLGNAGSATFYGLEADLILPLDGILPGARFEAGYRRRESSFLDPITNETRPLSDITDEFFSFEFRHDLVEEQFSWGLEMDGAFEEPNFFVDELLEFSGRNRFNIYAETTRYLGIKMRLEWNRFTGNTFNRDRFFFEGTRAGDFIGSELQTRRFGSVVRFIVTVPF